jgi:3-oxoacyl-[acyl-carrier protein] reductase
VGRFADVVVVLTGAGRGIGKAVAERFHEKGAEIVAVRLNPSEGEVRERWWELAFDVADPAQVSEAVPKVLERYGRIDVLVNAAAIFGPVGFSADIPYEDYLRTISVNLHGTFLMCRAVLPRMVERRGGKVVNFSSSAGTLHQPGQVAYNVSKAGVISLTKTLAAEVWSFGVHVNAICPGPVDTDMICDLLAKEPPDFVRRNFELFAEKRDAGLLWDPREATDLVLFLASPASDRITGQYIQSSSKWAIVI